VLVEALWGERPPKGARNTLQVYVSSLRKALGREVIETTLGGYRLRPAPGAVDAERFEASFREGRELLAADDPVAARERLTEGLGLWRGPALADLRYEAFAQAEAGRLEELRVACLEEQLEADLHLGRHATVVGELEALVVEHPLRERLRGQLILALYRSGRQSEALAQYQAARRMLADELGLEPSPELRELERLILAHDPMLAAPALHESPSNLPLQPTPFIGRERELAELVGLIRSGRRRLVTLTGAGGSGKTRLAIEAASLLRDDYRTACGGSRCSHSWIPDWCRRWSVAHSTQETTSPPTSATNGCSFCSTTSSN
jgi:DNA-binding SARP family transcriptional activator